MLNFSLPASTVYCIDGVVVTHEYAQTFQFTLDLEHTRAKSFEYTTPRIHLDGLTSNLVFRRYNSPNVSVTLTPFCSASEPMYLQTTLKLLGVPSKRDVSTKTVTLSNHLFDRKRCDPIFISQFDYFDMMANYTEYGNATFEIEITTNRVHPNLRPRAFGVVGRKFLFELKNVNLNSPTVKRVIAPIFTVRDITWSLFAEKKEGSLGIFLKANENELNTWFYKVDATVTLLSFKKGVDPIKYTFTHTYSMASPIHGNDKLISLSELFDLNKQYVFKNNLNLLVEIRVE